MMTEQIMKKMDSAETMDKTAQMLAPAMMVETVVMTEQKMLAVPLVEMDLTEIMLTEPLVKLELSDDDDDGAVH